MKTDVSKLYFLNGTLRANKQSDYPYLWLLKQGLENLGITYPLVSPYLTQYTLFVAKEYTGIADLNITATGISSGNTSYNEQLVKAIIGQAPFPSLWAAQEFAKPLAAQGIITNIVMRSGYMTTIGSPTLSQNGDSTGNASVNEEPDVKVANNTTAIRDYFSIGQRNINYIFEPDSGIVNICKSYMLSIIDIDKRVSTDLTITPNAQVTDTDPWVSNIYGKGQFKGLYGQVEGFIPTMFSIYGIPGLDMTIEADLVTCNMRNWATILSYTKLNLLFDKLWIYDSTANLSNYYDWEAGGLPRPSMKIKVRDYKKGAGLFTGLGASAVDWWGGLIVGGLSGVDCFVDIDSSTLTNYNSSGPHSLLAVTGAYSSNFSSNPFLVYKNMSVVANFKKLKQSMINVADGSSSSGLFSMSAYNAYALGQAAVNDNNRFTINIDQAEVGVPFNESYTMSGLLNSSFTLNVTDFAKMTSLTRALITAYIRGNISTTATNDLACINNQVTYSGRFISASAKGVFDTGLYSNTLANISTNFVAIRLDNVILIQKHATAPTVGLSLASWNDFINLSIKNGTLVNVAGNTIRSTDACNVLIQDVQVTASVDAAVTQVGGTALVVPTLSTYTKN